MCRPVLPVEGFLDLPALVSFAPLHGPTRLVAGPNDAERSTGDTTIGPASVGMRKVVSPLLLP